MSQGGLLIAGRYSLDRELGRGGMGAVWLGTDKVLGRQVALKQLTPVTAGGATPARAEREARLAARLSHPNLVAVFDLVIDGEQPWLVMEYVEGTTLAKLVAEHGPLSPDDAAALLSQVSDALLAAHGAGIVHRDVKPANILVTAEGQAKLTDFGIARGVDGDATVTQTGMVTGSPAYIAPEVASGAPAVPASDVWSLGATLFHAVTGRPPYDIGDNVLGTLYRIVHEEPPRTDRAGWLTPLLVGAMTRDPSQRWSMAQAHAFLAGQTDQTDQTEVLAGFPPPPPAPAPPPRSIAPEPVVGRSRRRLLPVLVGVLSVVAVGLLAALGVVLLHNSAGGGDTPRHQAQASAPATHSPSNVPRGRSGGAPSTGTPSTSTSAARPTADGVRSFVTDYLHTAVADPPQGFAMLTPSFRAASGGLQGYEGFWGRVTSIDGVQRIEPELDGNDLAVSYTYTYTYNGQRHTEDVHLRLVYENGRYLIAGD